jgi:drug/metabolite transporter (DMT)-like permease
LISQHKIYVNTWKNRVGSIANMPYLLLTLAVLFWSGNFILGRAIRVDIPPIGFAFWRWVGAALLATCLAGPHLKHDWKDLKRCWPVMLALSLLGIASFNTLVYIGLQSTMAINALLMQSMMPVLIVSISFFLFRISVTWLQTIGIMSSLMGVFTIIGRGDIYVLLSMTVNKGDILVFLAVICYALYSVVLRKRPQIHPLSFISATFIVGSSMLFPFYLWESHMIRPVNFDIQTLSSITYVAIFPSVVSYLCFNRGVELVGANRAGIFIHLMPVFGSIMAMVLLGESFRWYHGVGIGLITFGIILATKERK